MPNTLDLIAGLIFGIVGCLIIGYGLLLATKPLVGQREDSQLFRATACAIIGIAMAIFTIFAIAQAFP